MASPSDIGSLFKGHCGICGESVKNAEACIDLVQMKDSQKPFRCLDLSNSPCTEDVRLRREEWPGLFDNTASAAKTVHIDCFNTLRRGRIDDERLWMAATLVTLWPSAPDLHLKRDYIPLDSSLSNGLGLEILGKLPSELGALIHEHSSDCLLWRYNACQTTARRLRASFPEELSTSLANVDEWERGTSPSLASKPDGRAKVRLTVDAYGLKRIEYFEEDPWYGSRPRRTDNYAFVILEPHEARSTKVHFKFQHARLELGETCHGIQIWDTPSRPSPIQFFISPDPMQMHTFMHLRTVELDKITGLTFFVKYMDIYAIHAHTRSSPFAGTTYPRWSVCEESLDDAITWVYVPISEGDSVTAIGRRTVAETGAVWLHLRLKLAGDVVFGLIGPYDDGLGSFETVSSPTTLIHDIYRYDPSPIIVLGVHGGSGITTVESPLSGPAPAMRDLRMYLAYTSAPLQNIQRLRVFRSDNGYWRGMLLYYKNGAQRAVGECRVGVDDSTLYDDPRGICLIRKAARQYIEGEPNDDFISGDAVIKTGDVCGHGPSGLYLCRPLVGELAVWFSATAARIKVIL